MNWAQIDYLKQLTHQKKVIFYQDFLFKDAIY